MPGEISITSDMQMTPPLRQKAKEPPDEKLKRLLMKLKEKSEKDGLKVNIQKMKIMTSGSTTSCKIDGKIME